MTNFIDYVHKIETSNSKYDIYPNDEKLGFQLQKIELKYLLPFDMKYPDFCNTLRDVSIGGELVFSFENKAGETYQKIFEVVVNINFYFEDKPIINYSIESFYGEISKDVCEGFTDDNFCVLQDELYLTK